MKKCAKYLILWLSLLTGIGSHAQTYFNFTLDYDNAPDGFGSNILVNDTLYVSGVRISGYATLTLISSEGDIIRKQKITQGSGAIYNAGGMNLVNYDTLIFDARTIGTGGTFKPLLITYNTKGDSLNYLRYDPIDTGGFEALTLTRDTCLLAVGGEQVSGQEDFLLMKLDLQGNVIWKKNYGGSNNDRLRGAIHAPDGGYIVAGRRGNNSCVIKIDEQGDMVWQAVHPLTTGGGGIISLCDSSYITGGGLINQQGENRAYLWRIDRNGNTLKTIQLPNEQPGLGFLNTGMISIIEYSPETILITRSEGYNSSFDFHSYLTLMDTAGNYIYNRSYTVRPNVLHYLKNPSLNSQKDIYLTGWVPGDGSSTQDGWVLKVDSMGCLVSGCALALEEQAPQTPLSLYPNPTTGTAFVELPTGANYPLTLLTHDYTGREILRQNVSAPGTVQLDMPVQTKGMYIVTLNDAGGQVINRAKLVLIR